MSTQPLSIVSSEPLPSQGLSIVSSQPLPSPPVTASGLYGEALSKTAKNMNVENVLEKIGNIDTALGHGDVDWDSIKSLIPNPIAFAKDTWNKVQSGDMTGAAANLLPLMMMRTPAAVEEATPTLTNAADNAGTFVKGAAKGLANVRKDVGVHVGAGLASQVPVVGHGVALALEGGNALYRAGQGVNAAFDARSAAQAAAERQAATEAAIADSRANPRIPSWQQAGTQTTNPVAPEIQPITPAAASARQMAPMGPPAPSVEPRPVQLSTPAIPVAAPEPIVPSGPDPQVLDDLTSWSTNGKVSSFSKVKDSVSRQQILDLAGKLKPTQAQPETSAPASTPPPPVTSAPVVEPQVPEKSIAQQLKDLVQPDEDEEKAITPGTYWPTPQQIGMKEPWPTGDAGVTRHYINAYNKGANAADFVLNNKSGASPTTDPRVFDLDATKTQDFMDKAWDHGLGQGNPIPGKYTKPLGGDSLRFAKAYLQHFVDEKVTDSNTLADTVK